MPITFGNRGQQLVETNYWSSEYAASGLVYLSCNAGALRLLVPRSAEHMLVEMQTAAFVIVEPALELPATHVDVVFDDGTDTPFRVSIGPEMRDRQLTPGTSVPFLVYTEAGVQITLSATIRDD
jgi:hypothetical protein